MQLQKLVRIARLIRANDENRNHVVTSFHRFA